MGSLAKGIEKGRGFVEKAVRDVASDMGISPKVGTAEFSSMEGGYGGMGNMLVMKKYMIDNVKEE